LTYDSNNKLIKIIIILIRFINLKPLKFLLSTVIQKIQWPRKGNYFLSTHSYKHITSTDIYIDEGF